MTASAFRCCARIRPGAIFTNAAPNLNPDGTPREGISGPFHDELLNVHLPATGPDDISYPAGRMSGPSGMRCAHGFLAAVSPRAKKGHSHDGPAYLAAAARATRTAVAFARVFASASRCASLRTRGLWKLTEFGGIL